MEGLHAVVFRAVVAGKKTVENLQVAHASVRKMFGAVATTQRERCLMAQVAALHDLTRAVMVVATIVAEVMLVMLVMLFGSGTGAVLRVQESEGVVEAAAVRWVQEDACRSPALKRSGSVLWAEPVAVAVPSYARR